ncbi:DUF2490 domain-containing protein [Lutimonas zeaxanthinifaciens]|uniref:DUF2490 domain-containing protein n=1 Tax=Lutimonas zeaxanthinifaciens TaxID=3060215 RepID=UPI00265D2A81|nr:DUF2490 domain-containing protein [Lutimonas sp. YSD2104]WKK67602.1 DUF2490 domain-containing protein [Lutimonas sp. YSD2104]
MIRFLVPLFFILNFLVVSAQQEDPVNANVNRQFWLDFNTRRSLDSIHELSGFVGYRSISPHLFDKFLVVPTYNIIHTKSPKFMNLDKPLISSFHLGAGLYYTNNKYEPDNFEFRLMQGLKFFLPSIDMIPLKNYVRLEERFQKTFDGSYWNASFRFRYKISTVIEWKKHLFSFNKGLYIPMSVEFFFNLKKADRFNDVIRITPGLGYKFNEEWKAEFYVSYHYSQNTSEDDDSTNDFVFRLRIYKKSIQKKPPVFNTKEEDLKELIE